MLGLDGELVDASASGRGGITTSRVAAALFLGQQRDEGGVEIGGAGLLQQAPAGVPVASTRPAFIATSQSNRAASSI